MEDFRETLGTIAVLDTAVRHQHGQEQLYRIDADMALLTWTAHMKTSSTNTIHSPLSRSRPEKRSRSLFTDSQLIFDHHALTSTIILLAILFRLIQYLSNRSLWLDEAMLALNLLQRSFLDLLQPLDHNQASPLAFLTIEKILLHLAGGSEYALRFFPFLCGILSVFLFRNLAKKIVSKNSIPVALCLFAFSYKLIYYSSELKQYSLDVLITLILYLSILKVYPSGLNIQRSIILSFVGAIVIWFSHPAIFILAGLGMTLFIIFTAQRNWISSFFTVIVSITWATSFLICYFLFLSHLPKNDSLMGYWSSSFTPLFVKSLADIRHLDDMVFNVFRNPVGLIPTSLSLMACFLGILSMLFDKREKCIFLLSPVLFMLIASGLQRYPLDGRMLLFYLPVIYLLIAEGIMEFSVKNAKLPSMLNKILALVLIVPSLLYASSLLVSPISYEEIKPIFEHIKKNWQDGDILYIYRGARPAFEYYSSKYRFQEGDYIAEEFSKEVLNENIKEIEKLNDRVRVWVIFSHVQKRMDKPDDEKILRAYFNERGQIVDSMKKPGSSVYLYNLH